MKIPSRLLVFAAPVVLALASGCRASLPAGDAVGEVIEPRSVLALAVVDSSPSDYFEQTLLVEATAVAVCERAGCWMQIQDGDHTAMVRWEAGCGGAYEFPRDIVGKRVLVQGSFYPKVISEEDAAHLEEEAGEALTIEREGYEFNASAILVPNE